MSSKEKCKFDKMNEQLLPDIAEELNNLLFNSIKETVVNIDKELKEINETGIFFAPELYISFCIGKEIMQNRLTIFNSTNVKWERESNLGNGGPSDIIFKIDHNCTIVIELKIRDKINSYKRDIEKLKRCEYHGYKFFCVLADSFKPTKDNRLIELENFYQRSILKIDHHAFSTWSIYKKQTFCCLNLYLIS